MALNPTTIALHRFDSGSLDNVNTFIHELQGSIVVAFSQSANTVRSRIFPFFGFISTQDIDIASNREWSLHSLRNWFPIPVKGISSHPGGTVIQSFHHRVAYNASDYLVFGFSIGNMNTSSVLTANIEIGLYGWRWQSDFIHYDPNTG